LPLNCLANEVNERACCESTCASHKFDAQRSEGTGVLSNPHHGIGFKIDDKDWDFTDNSFFANPACSHAGNEKGIKIKLQRA
jgi:hypothetical protein